ncbi:Magnesium transporter MRS2-3 [Citrus sinensis]|uniref:Magnesium transporter MRS2-3 n=1 Tax=Citrus sinensis TaxID=2711 RepID=A0ACB8KK10_CITSI|nr:Magnesium transporter MRS2-3 [Citrus sinensis]
MRRTGLPARDLRILDPMLSYPSTILGRESAIVINLEQIKDIITAQEVLLLNSRDPSVAPFVEELKRRILCHYQATKAQEDDGDISNWKNLYDSGTPESRASSPPDFAGTGISESEEITEERKEDGKQGLENRDGPKVLPFEFVALEACLESACSCLENEATTLEQEAHPALDKLTSKISTLNLERVRQIKSRLVAISGLEHLLTVCRVGSIVVGRSYPNQLLIILQEEISKLYSFRCKTVSMLIMVLYKVFYFVLVKGFPYGNFQIINEQKIYISRLFWQPTYVLEDIKINYYFSDCNVYFFS